MTTITTAAEQAAARAAVRDGIAIDFLTTAVEGGTGYWAEAIGYRWDTDRHDRDQIGVTLVETDGTFCEHPCRCCSGRGWHEQHDELIGRTVTDCTQCKGVGGIGVRLNIDTILWAIDNVIAGAVGKFFNSGYSQTLRARLFAVDDADWTQAAREDLDFDADDADAIAQIAALGTLVYS